MAKAVSLAEVGWWAGPAVAEAGKWARSVVAEVGTLADVPGIFMPLLFKFIYIFSVDFKMYSLYDTRHYIT